jgi:hypothetical protein
VAGLDPDPIAALGRRAAAAELHTASLDEVLCIAAVHQVQQADSPGTDRGEGTPAENTAGTPRRQTKVLLPRMTGYVLDKWKVIYVVTPKAMCTSMLWLMAGLQNENLARDVAHSRAPEVTRALAVHDPELWRKTRLLHSLPADEIERVTSDGSWFRFGFTRHPVDRLWSAWQSKLLLREPTFATRYGAAPWFPRTPTQLPNGAAALDAIAKDFENLVGALAQDPKLLVSERHWAPQSFLLCPEDFPYSEIGRVEAAAATLGRLEGHLRAQGWRGTLEPQRLNTTLLPRTIIRDPTLLRLIEKTYADDMSAFGYEPADIGRPPATDASAVMVQALAELVDRHERISDLHRLLAPEYYRR